MRTPVRPAGARNGVGRTRGPDLRPRRVSGSLTRFRVDRRSGVPNAAGRPPFCRLRATLAEEKANLGFLCRKGGAERSEGVPRSAPFRPPAGRTASSGGHTTEPRRHPRRPESGESTWSLVEPPARAGAGSSHGNSQYATATVAARTATELVSGRQKQLLASRFPYRGWCSATPSARRPRSASAPIPRTAGSGAAANAKARSLVPVRVLMATSGPSRFTACCRPESPATGHTVGDALRPGWTAISRGDTRRRRETPTSGPKTPRGRLPEKEPAPSSRSRPCDHQRHVDDNPATAVHAGGQGRIPRSIGFRYHHGGRRDRSQRTGNTR